MVHALLMQVEVEDNLKVNHQEHKVQVDQGYLVWAKGPGANVVSESIDVPQGAELTISSSGSIWLYAYYYTAAHSSNSGGYATITNYRLDALTGVGTQFLASAPARGTDTSARYSAGYLYYEIAKLEVVSSEVFVTAQIANGPIYVNELSDSVLS